MCIMETVRATEQIHETPPGPIIGTLGPTSSSDGLSSKLLTNRGQLGSNL